MNVKLPSASPTSQPLWRSDEMGKPAPQRDLFAAFPPFETTLARADARLSPSRSERKSEASPSRKTALPAKGADQPEKKSRQREIKSPKQTDADAPASSETPVEPELSAPAQDSEAPADDVSEGAIDGVVENSETSSPMELESDVATLIAEVLPDEAALVSETTSQPQDSEQPVAALAQIKPEHAAKAPTALPQVHDAPVAPTNHTTAEDATDTGDQPLPQAPPTVEAKDDGVQPASAATVLHDGAAARPAAAETSNATTAPIMASTASLAPTSNGTAARDIAAPPPIPVPDSSPDVDGANVARVARGLQSALQQNGGSVTLRLHPPEMGFVRIELEIVNGTVSATLQSETSDVRQLLTQQLAQLRQGLENQGLSVERLNVQGLPHTNTHNQTNGQSAQEDFRNPTEDGRSRGGWSGGGDGGRNDHGAQGERHGRSARASFADLMLNELA